MAPSSRSRRAHGAMNSQRQRPTVHSDLPRTGGYVRDAKSIRYSGPPKRILPPEAGSERAAKTARTETAVNPSSQGQPPLQQTSDQDINIQGSSFSQGRDSGSLSQPGDPAAPAAIPNSMPQLLARSREASVPTFSFSGREPNPASQNTTDSGSGNSHSYQRSSQELIYIDDNEAGESIPSNQPMPAISIPSSDRIKISQSDNEAFEQLTLCARRQFIATLDNKRVTWPVEQAFPGLSATRDMYKNAVTRVRDLYKTWKNKSLDLALRKFNNWILTLTPRQAHKIRASMDFILVNQAIASRFELSWVFDIFPWAQQVISIDDCSTLGQDWLKYITTQLMTMTYFASLTEQDFMHCSKLRTYNKWNRHAVLHMFDDLHTCKRFQDKLSIGDFPQRLKPAFRIRRG
ncbi:hypothetical protein BO70DRAFT_366533, partial [Aspergillus heteromorphus CBS 117.55]